MGIRARLTMAVVLSWTAAAPVHPLHAAAQTIRFEVGLPDESRSGTLLWGVMRGGLELGRGSASIAALRSSGDVGPASLGVRLEHALPTDQPAPVARFCINNDDLASYTPSFGDLFQVVPLRLVADRWVAAASRTGWHQRTARSPESVLTIHYHRFERDYDDASLWTWDERLVRAPEQNELYPVGRDDFGLVFQLDTSRYGKPGDKVGLLPRLRADWQFKDGPDRFWSPDMGREVYLVKDRPQTYATRPDVRPSLAAATLDGDRLVTVRFTHRLPVADWPAEKFQIASVERRRPEVRSVTPVDAHDGRAMSYAIETDIPLRLSGRVDSVSVDGLGGILVRPGRLLFEGDRFHDEDAILGASYTPTATTFRVFAPTAAGVRVVIADGLDGDAGVVEHWMWPRDKGIFEGRVSGDLHGRFYAYKLSGRGFDPDAEVTDIYATCTQGRHARSLIVDLRRTDPPGFRDHTFHGVDSAADAIVYEMHVRDFTIASDSGVRHKGRFLALTESGTRLVSEASVKTGLDHLSALGATHVQLMPVQDFDNSEQSRDPYNWGYMPVHFNAPDGWFATTVTGPAKIRELKQAIQALHERGIGVILDVVYNHTAGHAPFERLVPGYYFRMNDDGGFSNGSGCGNEFASEHPMARKFIVDSIRFWADEYKVDGFRFDLMGLVDLETMKRLQRAAVEIRPGLIVYGEPWTGGATPLSPITGKHEVRGTGIGAFNDHFRDAIKGDRDGGSPGFIQVGDRRDGVVKGLQGAIHDWSTHPTDTVNYFEAHDNLTAWDKLLQSVPDASDPMRKRMMRFASLILLTSQGQVFLHSGQEFCRSKQGHHNSYNLPDEINRIDWSLAAVNRDVCDYVRGLIAFRKAHPVVRLRRRSDVESRASFPAPPTGKCVVYRLDGSGLVGESARVVLVLLNGDGRAIHFPLPGGPWSIHADAERAGAEPHGQAADQVTLPAHSGMILVQ